VEGGLAGGREPACKQKGLKKALSLSLFTMPPL